MGMGKKNKEEKDNLSRNYTERSSLLDAKCRKANASLQWDQRRICHICTVESDNKKCYCCKWNEIWYSMYRWEKQTFCCVQLPNCLWDLLMFSEWRLSKCFLGFFLVFTSLVSNLAYFHIHQLYSMYKHVITEWYEYQAGKIWAILALGPPLV